MSLNNFGVDISMHNGRVDFDALKANGVKAVYIKATEGVNYKDPLYKTHYSGAKEAGVPFGFYHFMSEITDPAAQAKDFYDAIKYTGYQLKPCLDIETNQHRRSAIDVSARVMAFLRRFKELSGEDCIIYTGGYFGRDLLIGEVKNYQAWIAHYEVSSPMATGFNKVIGHQYTENGRINGIGTICDLNNFSNDIFLNNVEVETPETPIEPKHPGLSYNNNIINATRIQNELINAGYSCGQFGADGIFGQDTLNALIQFQKDHGLSPDGLLGPNTENILFAPAGSALIKELQTECNAQGFSDQTVDGIFGTNTLNGCPTIRRGAKGNITKILQKLLGVNADGIFGSNTKTAVTNFQKSKGLVPDGICGKNTWRALLQSI